MTPEAEQGAFVLNMFARLHRFISVGNRLYFEFRFRLSHMNLNIRILPHILVPLRIGTVDWQQIELFVFSDEPDRIRDLLPDFLPMTLRLIWR